MSNTAASRRRRVLLAPNTGWSDVLAHFEVLKFTLGCTVDLKNFGRRAVLTEAMPGEEEYDLIIQMGLGPDEEKINGLEFLRRLAKRYPGVPILVVSGHDPAYALAEVVKAGAADFLQRNKADEPAEFVRKVRELLQRKTAPS